MANEVLVGLKIGAAVSGTLHAAFGSARSTVQQLGRATDGLTAKQKQLGSDLAASVARGGAGIERMRRQYDQVGRTIDQLKAKQDRLNTSIARGETLKEQRGALRGEFMETAGTAAALGAPVVLAMREAINFQDEVRDIRITAGFDASEEVELGKMVRGIAIGQGQAHSAVNAGVGTLVAGGLGSLDEIRQFAPTMAEAATATGASMEDLGKTTLALRDHLGITGESYREAMNMLAAGGKAGSFELVDMAKHLPTIGAMYGAMGQKGKAAVAEMTAALQVVRMGAGSSDEAANNFRNFLSKLSSPDTIKSFEDAGIDLQDAMRGMAAEGLSPVKSMLNIVGAYLGDKGPEAAEQYTKALEIKDDAEREMAVQRLDEAYKLGELFRDQQVLGALRPLLANRDKVAAIEGESTAAADQDVLGADAALRRETAGQQLRELRVNLVDLGIAVGSVLLPALVDITQAALPVIQGFAAWAGENPGLIRGIVGLVGGLLAGKLAIIGLKYGVNLVISPFVSLTTTITTLSAKWTVLQAMWQAGRFAPVIGAMTKVGAGMLSVLKYSGLFVRGFAMAFGAPLLMAARGGLLLGQVLGGTLLFGLRLAGQAVLWLGRALLMNPIGLAITGIALGAYLIYRNWEPIKGFFSGLWAEVRTGFNGGLSGIVTTLLNFSPLGLFYRAFAGVMSYFGIELPGKFSEFGGLIVGNLVGGIRNAASAAKDALLDIGASIKIGLVDGINNTAGAARDAVVGVGTSIKSGFRGVLGINSPSRVFMGYGANLSEGAAIGISAQSGLVRKAALGMAAATAVSLAPPSMAAINAGMAAPGAAGGSMVVHFSPTIYVQGSGAEAGDQVHESLQRSFAEFERNMRQWQYSQARTSFGGRT